MSWWPIQAALANTEVAWGCAASTRPRYDCRVRVDITRQRSQSWGLFGGGPGGHGKVEAGPGVMFEGDSAVLKTGQWFAVVTPGAGGFGPPDKRDPAAIARDQAEGVVTGVATH